ncbi:MAG: hypothetical protein ACJ8LI_02555 [Chthoniobacterales bacterium]
MHHRWFNALILASLLASVGCASSKDAKSKKPPREKKEAYLQQTGSNVQHKLDLEDEEAEAKKKEEKKKLKEGKGKVDEDFVLRGGFR